MGEDIKGLTEISVKGTFVPEAGPPENFNKQEEATLSGAGMELSASYNLLGHYLRDNFIVVGPRVDLAMSGTFGRRYRSNPSLPIKTVDQFEERVQNPDYELIEEGKAMQYVSRVGVVAGIGPNHWNNFGIGIRLFATVGPELTEGYKVTDGEGMFVEEKGRDVSLSLKTGAGWTFTLPYDCPKRGDSCKNFGLNLEMAGVRLFNPLAGEPEWEPQLSGGVVVSF